jgi:hypothetical protein
LAAWNFSNLAPLLAAAAIFGRVNNWRVGVLGVFAVLGAALGFPAKGPAETSSSFTRSDLILAIAAIAMVRLLAHGIRLAH